MNSSKRSVVESVIAIVVAVLVVLALPIVARAQIAVMSSTVEETHAAAGGKYTANIVIANPGKTPQSVRIYKTDYTFACDGTSDFGEPGTLPRSNAKWIALQAERVTIPAGGQVIVPYSVTVPALDSLRGTYWSTVMVEGATAEPAQGQAAKPAVAIGAVMRYAVQVATHIQATGTRTVRFAAPKLSRDSAGAALFDVDVHDDGERGYRPSLWIELYDAQGNLRAKAKQTRGLLYPGTSLHQQFNLGAIAPGTYKAIVFADTGDEVVSAAQYTVNY